jgi:hypothetical protein
MKTQVKGTERQAVFTLGWMNRQRTEGKGVLLFECMKEEDLYYELYYKFPQLYRVGSRKKQGR